MAEPIFPHLGLKVDDDAFLQRLCRALESSGHLVPYPQVRACLLIVDHSFAPPAPQPQLT